MDAKPIQAMLDSLGENHIPRGSSLPIEVAERLRAAIQDREIVEGNNKLPTEAALAKAYGVSRPVIREAISLLKSEGLIISHQGRGQFVNPQGSNVFRLEPAMDTDEDVDELFEFLQSVEVSATRLAAQRRTSADLERIQNSYQRLYRATQESLDGADEDEEFHKAIICASHNQYFIAFANFLDGRVRRLIRAARRNTRNRSQELVWQVQSEHEAILKAIEAGDADQASLAASTHLNNAASRLASYNS